MDIKYLQLEPAAYPADTDWQAMSAAERGCFHSLIIYLSCNDGRLLNDRSVLRNLCNADEETFEKFFKNYGHKFITNDGKLRHKRVDKELKKARKYQKQKSLAGKASGEARRAAVKRPLERPLSGCRTKETKANKSKEIRTNKNPSQRELALENQILALDFDGKLEKFFGPFVRGERVTFRHIREWLYAESKLATGLRAMKDSKTWQDDHGKERIEGVKCFVAKIKKMGWMPKGTKND